MRNSYPEYHEYLQIAKLAGTLSEEDRAVFEELMSKDEQFHSSFLLLQQQIPETKLIQLEKYRDHSNWEDLTRRFSGATVRNIFITKWVAAASIVVLLGFGTWFFLRTSPSHQPSFTQQKLQGIELRLADGKKLNLSENKGTIDAAGARLDNTGKILSYRTNGAASDGTNILTIAPGMDYKITLADGTDIWLNSATTLKFPFAFTGNTREISITGEAYLEVAKDPRKPFIVRLPGGSVQVLGTEFNVNTYDSGTLKVALVQGSVAISAADRQLKLNPGHQAVSNGSNITDQPFESKTTLSWMKGILYFDEVSLSEIAKVIPRLYNISVVIDNNRNVKKQFVGILNKNRPLSIFLEDLRAVADIQSYYDNKGTLHFK